MTPGEGGVSRNQAEKTFRNRTNRKLPKNSAIDAIRKLLTYVNCCERRRVERTGENQGSKLEGQ